MVAPRAVIALAWEGRWWGSWRLVHGGKVRVGLGRLAREMPLGTAAFGVVLIGMGAVTLVTAVTGPSMPSSGWQVSFAAWLGHVSSVTGRALSWLPGWAALAALSGLAAPLACQVRRARRPAGEPAAGAAVAGGPGTPGSAPPGTSRERR